MHQLDSETPEASCRAVRLVVYEFLDDEMPPPEAQRINQHLLACPPCAGYFNFERAYLLVLKRRTTIDSAPADLRERLRTALASRGQRLPPA